MYPHSYPFWWVLFLLPFFVDEQTEAQRGRITCPRLHWVFKRHRQGSLDLKDFGLAYLPGCGRYSSILLLAHLLPQLASNSQLDSVGMGFQVCFLLLINTIHFVRSDSILLLLSGFHVPWGTRYSPLCGIHLCWISSLPLSGLNIPEFLHLKIIIIINQF